MNTFLVLSIEHIKSDSIKRVYSTFDLKYLLKITGANESIEKANSMTIELHENAIDELVILYSVLPASIARNDGGATLKICQF